MGLTAGLLMRAVLGRRRGMRLVPRPPAGHGRLRVHREDDDCRCNKRSRFHVDSLQQL
jgi:hypothetical protein